MDNDESTYPFIYNTVTAFYQFEQFIDSKLHQKYYNYNEVYTGYLIDKDYYDYWRDFSNYDQIKNDILFINYEEAQTKIKQYRKLNVNKDYPGDATQIVFKTPEELENAIKNEGKSFVLVDENIWKYICPDNGLDEEGAINYMIRRRKLIFLYENQKRCIIFTDNNIINNSQILQVQNLSLLNKSRYNSHRNTRSSMNSSYLKSKNIDNINNVSDININKFKNSNTDGKEEMELRKILLLYAFEQEMKNKINNITYNDNSFNIYCLINKDWMAEYKKYYCYNEIINMIQKKQSLKSLLNKGFNEAKRNMNLILNEIHINKNCLNKPFPQNLTQIKYFLCEKGDAQINNKTISYWTNFVLVNEELKNLLSESELHDYSIENAIYTKCLISSGKAIIDLSGDIYNENNFVYEIGTIRNKDMVFIDEFLFDYDNEEAKDNHVRYFSNDFFAFQKGTLNFDLNLQSNLLSPNGNIVGTAFKIPPHDFYY